MDYIDPKKITYLPNTAGCFTSEEALRTLRLAREIGGWKLVKLEVLGDKKTLLPKNIKIYDEKGLFEELDYFNVKTNLKFASNEFTKGFKDYSF